MGILSLSYCYWRWEIYNLYWDEDVYLTEGDYIHTHNEVESQVHSDFDEIYGMLVLLSLILTI
jgi:hypothetical protein